MNFFKKSILKTGYYFDYFKIRSARIQNDLDVTLDSLNIVEQLPCWNADIHSYHIFGNSVELENIHWHRDAVSNFEFPKKLFFNVNIYEYFNKGYDVKWPWELARFQFAPLFALSTDDDNDRVKRYLRFKKLVLNWIEENPVCIGVHWLISMEVAIRAVNIAVAANMFNDLVQADDMFKKKLTTLFIHHARYISTYVEKFENGLTTNHTSSNYAGLLFLSLVLKPHRNSQEWSEKSIEGLEQCIRQQTYSDGVNFEASVAYHRLNLEMFSLSALVAKANKISISDDYYEALFLMFEYVAAYLDDKGNTPQIGDNDSGRFLRFTNHEQDHSYLLDIGSTIFDYDFKRFRPTTKPVKNKSFEPLSIDSLNIIPRSDDSCFMFQKGGAYIFKNHLFTLFVSCFPIGMKGLGGHNHADIGSFTLSVRGIPLIVDPGTFTYTRNSLLRDKFRSYSTHNVIISDTFGDSNFQFPEIWKSQSSLNAEVLDFNKWMVRIKVFNTSTHDFFIREFELNNDRLFIRDNHKGNFISQINIHPELSVISSNNGIEVESICKIESDSESKFCEGLYSDGYDRICKNRNIVQFSGKERMTMSFQPLEAEKNMLEEK